jgi:hypothetical protein
LLARTLGAAAITGFANNGLTCLAITSCSPEQSVVQFALSFVMVSWLIGRLDYVAALVDT